MAKRFLFIAITLISLGLNAGGDAAKGKKLYATCSACHGPHGEGMKSLNSPALAGQEEWYLQRQIQYFKDGIRGTNPKDIYGMQMRPMAMILADQQAIDDVVAYIMTFEPYKPKGFSLDGDAAAGKAKYDAICATCHGPNAEGNKAMNAPKLNNQHDWYMLTQLKHFKEGVRGANPKDIYGMQMRPMSMTLADEKEMKDVVRYITQTGMK
jgi:cytochrome c oxidase subunit 2